MARRSFRVIRKVRRRRVRPGRLLGSLAVVALLAGAIWLMQGPVLRLHSVAVNGGPASLWRASGLRLGMRLWAMNIDAADREILRRDRFLRTASFARRWPDRLLLRVTYRRPVAAVAGAGGVLYGVDPTGRVLSRVGSGGDLPVLQGVKAQMVTPYRDLPALDAQAAKLVAQLLHAGLQVAEVVPGQTPQIYLPSGTEVLWPHASKVPQTLAELRAILRALRAKGAVASSIDLRLPRHPLVVLRK